MAMFVPLSWPKKFVLAVLIAFQFVHPLGILLFLGAAGAALMLARGDPANRQLWLTRAAWMAFFCVAAAAKVYITSKIPGLRDSFAEQEANWHTALDRWRAGVRGWPLRGLWFFWASAIGALLHRYWVVHRSPGRGGIGGVARHRMRDGGGGVLDLLGGRWPALVEGAGLPPMGRPAHRPIFYSCDAGSLHNRCSRAASWRAANRRKCRRCASHWRWCLPRRSPSCSGCNARSFTIRRPA